MTRRFTPVWAKLATILTTVMFAVVTYYLAPHTANPALCAALSFIAATACIVVILRLSQRVSDVLHFWIVLVALLIGYYVKFGVLAYYRAQGGSELTAIAGSLGELVLENPTVVLETYVLITAGFVVFVVTTMVLTRPRAPGASQNMARERRQVRLTPTAVVLLIATASILFAFTVYIQVEFMLEAAYAGRPALPYRLGGVVQATQRVVVPFIFLYAIWAAGTARALLLEVLAVGFYAAHALIAAFITTSRASVAFAFVALTLSWLFAKRVTRVRLLVLCGSLVGLIVVSVALGDLRQQRAGAISLTQSLQEGWVGVGSTEDLSANSRYIAVIVRWSGADALLNIVDSKPTLSLGRIAQVLTGQDGTDRIYAQEVLRWKSEDLFGVAFAPSLLGAFYLLSGSKLGVTVGVVLFTAAWHWLFRFVMRLKLALQPVLFVMLQLTLMYYSSDGTIETLPFSLFLIGLTVAMGEVAVRMCFGVDPTVDRQSPLKSERLARGAAVRMR